MSPEDNHKSDPASPLEAVITGSREKQRVALTSVGAAVALTAMKVAVGLATASLGILAEAAHSALDLVAAVITCFAVRVSDRPADADHLYGHGKVENLSALVETLLLIITCGWIIYEAVERLFFRRVHIDANIWAFLVIIISIIIDVSRSRALRRVAQKHGSQALEADALHFSTDVWSSAVVLLGLVLVKIGELAGGNFRVFDKADAGAALLVAAIVVGVSVKLGRRTIDALLDRAPAGMTRAVEKAVREIDGVLELRRLRLRESGNRTFVDLVIGVRRGLSLESSHAIGSAVEDRIRTLFPKADVVVHVDPICGADETLAERIRAVAANCGQTVHNVAITDEGGRTEVELHVEAEEDLDLGLAHRRADELEAAVIAELPHIARITTHIEPLRAGREPLRDVTDRSNELIGLVRRIAQGAPGVVDCHDVIVRKAGAEVFLTMHCTFAAGQSVRQVHDAASALERRLRQAIPHLARVTTHPEPVDQP